jgi:D-arabinose 1-dehydrogenase-like Zn-dependent alcohol dehydrogenase
MRKLTVGSVVPAPGGSTELSNVAAAVSVDGHENVGIVVSVGVGAGRREVGWGILTRPCATTWAQTCTMLSALAGVEY